MNIVLIGPQGSGKGEQSRLLKQRLGLIYFSPGETLRELVKKQTPLARQIDEIMNKQGKLVPDTMIMKVVNNYFADRDIGQGIVFDGFPRNLPQAKLLDEWVLKRSTKIDKVIFLVINREESIKRLSSRLECPKCEAVFNTVTKPPLKNKICDACGAKLGQRADDKPAAIAKRLDIFEQESLPVVDFYRQKGILEEVDGERPIEAIFEDILERLKTV